MVETTDWAERVDVLVNDAIACKNVGMLRSNMLDLVQQAYRQGLGASTELAQKRRLVVYLLPTCTPAGESPGMSEIVHAQQLVDEIYATVK